MNYGKPIKLFKKKKKFQDKIMNEMKSQLYIQIIQQTKKG